jgi:hypothetical protein
MPAAAIRVPNSSLLQTIPENVKSEVEYCNTIEKMISKETKKEEV